MRRRRVLALLALVGMLLLSGCLGFFGDDSVPAERLDQEPAGDGYAWNESVDVHVTVRADSTFQGVYRVNGSELVLYRNDGLGGRNPLDVRAVRYRYPNGTVIDGSTLAERGSVRETRDEVTIRTPVAGGQVAFTAESTPKRFVVPTYVEGSYEVVLPPDRDVSVPVFGRVSPGGAETRTDAQDRVHVTWDEVATDTVLVQFYLERDLSLFGGLLAVFGALAIVGVAYYRRQIRELRETREEMGLDVDVGDDDGRDPPPGRR
ncbi:DUF5803 family protein [Halorarum halobium]|uniref:DUF5803 family protein n=1 Tax=Halorarum halobium TaxID=3075121 RepID=UPI0028AE4FE0|nr:DUF5803 family protein [Halobaculum sp. XH14]